MVLAINIGNTNIAVGNFSGNDAVVHRYNHKERKLQEDFINSLKEDFLNKKDIKTVAIASVVPELTPVISDMLLEATGKNPILINTSTDFGLDFSAYDSRLLGTDRLLCCVAALNKYQVPAIVIDLGTAITVNVLDIKGAFIGGSILPGIQMGLDALTKGTALLPKGKLVVPDTIIGNNTATCLTSGAIYGAASIIEGMVNKTEKELGYRCSVIVTGGSAKDIIPFCDVELVYDPNLLLEGIVMTMGKQEV